MTVTVDTNLLVYASDETSPFNASAVGTLNRLAEGPEIFYLFWPVIMGYLRISTHPAIFDNPLSPQQAQANIAGLIERPQIKAPGEPEDFWDRFGKVTGSIVVTGNLVTDAHIATLMQAYGVKTIYSRDSDFRKFPGVRTVDPLTLA